MGTSQGCLGEGVGALAPWLPITVRNQHVLFGAMLSPHGAGFGVLVPAGPVRQWLVQGASSGVGTIAVHLLVVCSVW